MRALSVIKQKKINPVKIDKTIFKPMDIIKCSNYFVSSDIPFQKISQSNNTSKS